MTFALVPDAAWTGSDQWPWSTAPATGPGGRLGRPSVSDPWGVGFVLSLGRPTCVQCPGPPGSYSPVCPLGVLFCVCGVLGLLAPVHRCARSVCCVACAVSWATWLLFTGVPALCVVLRVRCPGPPGSCSPVCPLGVLFRVCGVLGHLDPFFFCNTSPKSLLESPQEASPSYRVSPTSQVTVSGWGSREEKGAVDSGFAFVQNN